MDNPQQHKRPRLSNACNLCRKRKVRCDDRQPNCTNCVRAGVQCTTWNPRKPDRPAERQEAGRHASSRSIATLTTSPDETQQTATEQLREAEGRLPALPRFKAGHGSSVLTQWLDMALFRLGITSPLCHIYQSSSAGSLQRLRTLVQEPGPQMPGNRAVVPTFDHVSGVSAIFPLPVLFSRSSTPLPADNEDDEGILKDSIVLLRQACVGDFDGNFQTTLFKARNAIAFALKHLGSIVCTPSPLTVQLLVLLSLQLRGCDQANMAWHIITLANSMAQTIGLHRRSYHLDGGLISTSCMVAEELHCIWWSVYILERTLALELERSSNIRDSDCDLDLPYLASSEIKFKDKPLFRAAVHLAHIHGELMNRLLQNRTAEENATVSVANAICEKIRAIGLLDTMLQRWIDTLPSGLRPDHYHDCDPALLPGVAHLALQLHTTEFILHRHALIVDRRSITTVVEHHFATEIFRHRLLNAHYICAHSTRAIVAILGHLHENDAFSILNALHPVLLAAYGLAVHIISRPSAVTARSDKEYEDIAVGLIDRHDGRMSQLGIADNEEVVTRGQTLQRLRDIVTSSMVHSQERTSPDVNSELVPATPHRQNQSLQQHTTITSSQGPYHDAANAINTFGHDNFASALTPGLFSDGMVTDEFDWDTFANAFNFG